MKNETFRLLLSGVMGFTVLVVAEHDVPAALAGIAFLTTFIFLDH